MKMKVKGVFDRMGLESCAPIKNKFPYKSRAMANRHRGAKYYEAAITKAQFDKIQKLIASGSTEDYRKALKIIKPLMRVVE